MDELFLDFDAIYGLPAGSGTDPWFDRDFQILLSEGFEEDFDASDLNDINNDGTAGLVVSVMNDTRVDGDNVFVIRLHDSNPATANYGFAQDVFDFEEAPIDVPFNTFYTTDLGMTAGSTIQTAIILIRDDESPNRRTNGNNSANTYSFTDSINDTILLGGGNDIASAGGGNDIVFGQFGDDTLRGQDGNDMLFGNDGSDRLEGGNGSDTLDGGAGADNLIGGSGNDVYIIDNPGDVINDSRGTGEETVEVYNLPSYTLTDGIDFLFLKHGVLNGFGNDVNNRITGNALNNRLEGREGNDTLDGGLGSDTLLGGADNDFLRGGDGADTLLGGAGNDTLDAYSGEFEVVDRLEGGEGNDLYIVGEGDIIVDTAGTGTETVLAYVDWNLGPDSLGLDHLILEFGGGQNGTGNGLNNRIIGNNNFNTLNGLGGNDTLYGVEGDDNLIGGFGNDTLYGGNGNDTLNGYGTTVNDVAQIDVLMGGGGSDVFVLGGSWGVAYDETGDGYALITDFDAKNGASDTVFDQIQVNGSSTFYRLEKSNNVAGGSGLDTEIFYIPTGDRIGIVQDTINVQLGRDFIS